ncbi:MAG TPA: hypothetical protein V6D13_14600 [Halomicronema sp.]
MTSNSFINQTAIAELFGSVWNTGYLSRSDRQQLVAALLDSDISGDEKQSVKRLLHAVHRGWVKIMD